MHNERGRKADRLSGMVWIVFGTVIVGHALTMETRAYLGATFQTGPGLVPAMIGSAIAVLGLVLVMRGPQGEAVDYFDGDGFGGRRVLIALGLMLLYGLVLIGRLPFGIATFLFVSVFVTVFNLPAGNPRGLAILAAKAVVMGGVVSVVVQFAFETVFLVRLP